MKKIIALFVVFVVTVTLLNGCTLLSGDTLKVTFTLNNSTEYEIGSIWYFAPPRFGSSSPNHDILTAEDKPLKPGEEREFTIYLYKDQIEYSGGIYLAVPGIEDEFNAGGISFEKAKNIIITCDDNMNFTVTAVND